MTWWRPLWTESGDVTQITGNVRIPKEQSLILSR